MFDNQPTEQILRWISQGQMLQQQSELFRHQALSPDTLLVAGFCALELQRALDFFHGFAPALQSSITHWVDGLLAADYRNNEFVETLGDRFHAVLIRGLATEAGKSHCYQIRCKQARKWIATIHEPRGCVSHRFDLELWDGAHLLGQTMIEKASIKGAEHSLLMRYAPRDCIIGILSLCLANERGSCEVPLRSKLWAPGGASALVEVGLQRSSRVLWADDATQAALKHTPAVALFPKLEGVAPGRYAYYSGQFPKESPHPVDGRHDHYALQFPDDLGGAYANQIHNDGWTAWQARSDQEDPSQADGPLSLALCVDLRLTSGDVLLGCDPGDFNWAPYGRGTIEAYRIVRQRQHLLDVHVLGAYERYLAELMGMYPFVKVAETYSRYEDWALEIVETRSRFNLVSACSSSRHGLLCKAIPRILWRLAQ
ncbi:hypothetical protein RBE51_21255 [Pseudomonas taiwanensis]|uniref:hypothetical protein n=1 Tax=Pseudomonas taiwanensis TaxID=470150 RepID=UPI0028DE1EBF|nr:hypothetical protein [Pseudomonas taiwanensis]MDT8925326.1 hypothetical protein [Pseudomonas taiwanensis]